MMKSIAVLLAVLMMFTVSISVVAEVNEAYIANSGVLEQQSRSEEIALYATQGSGVSSISEAFGSSLIRRGSTGNYVKNVQLCLCARGFNVDVDGIFGSKTEEAVMSYQSLMWLDDDGIVGPDTKDAFWNDPECKSVLLREGY